MSAPAARQHTHNKPSPHDPPSDASSSHKPLQTITLPHPATEAELSASADSAPSAQQQSQSVNVQDAVQGNTTALDSATQPNTSLQAQSKQPEANGVDQQQHQQEVKAEGVEPTLGTIELVEHAPGTIAIEEAVNVAEETSEWVQDGDQMKRVKVSLLFHLSCATSGIRVCLRDSSRFPLLGL